MSNEATTQSKAAPLPAPPVEKIKIKIDGKEVEVPKTMPDWQGNQQPTTMLQACQYVGIEIPHYCYHPKLPIAGNCRMCLIEFGTPMMGPDRKPVLNEDGTPKIAKSVLPYEPSTPRGAIGCATGITPGMELYPNSAATKQMREAVLESLLINHPLDCPICDQAGECKLQEYSVQHGQAQSRFVETKVHKPKQVDLGPRIMLDDERCVLCSRCVRFTRDVVGDDALGFVNRGSYNTLAAFPGREFDNNYTLNTVDICPVGALTSKDFRFQMRVWFLKETKSVCTSCATGCNITVGSREGKVYRYEPRDNDAVNASWMCDQGRLNYKWAARADRLVKLGGSKLQGKSWTAATLELAQALQALPSGSLAFVVSGRQTTEELFLLKRIAEVLNASIDCPARTGEADKFLVHADKNPNATGAKLLGISVSAPEAVGVKLADGIKSGKIKGVVVFGESLAKLGVSAEQIKRLEVLAVSDILPNASLESAHYILPGAAHLEKRGTFVTAKGRVQKFMAAVEAPGDARPELDCLLELYRNLGGVGESRGVESVFNRLCREIPAFAGLEWSALGDAGVSVQL